MTNQKTLLFIPDISGFTDFVNQTEITHSSHIISELLEILIHANDIGLSISEIEGDAILFFKDRDVPSLEKLIKLAENMFTRFHSHLQKYDYERICRCGACRTANKLSLKFIIHTGQVNQISVGDHQKLHGKEVILAHKLLKNDVPFDEYVLYTDEFSDDIRSVREKYPDYTPETSHTTFDETRRKFYYFSLKPLLKTIPETLPVSINLSENTVSSEEVIIKKQWMMCISTSMILNNA